MTFSTQLRLPVSLDTYGCKALILHLQILILFPSFANAIAIVTWLDSDFFRP